MYTCKFNVRPFLIVQSDHKSYGTDRVQLKNTVYAFIVAHNSLILTILNQPLI